MPPDLAKQAEALAKKENRTMSELLREALRRYRQPKLFDLREYIRLMAPTPPAYQAVRTEAKGKGMHKLTMAQIDREVAAARRGQPPNKTKRSSK